MDDLLLSYISLKNVDILKKLFNAFHTYGNTVGLSYAESNKMKPHCIDCLECNIIMMANYFSRREIFKCISAVVMFKQFT